MPEVKSLVCVSWDPTSGHSSELMRLSLSTIPGPRWSLTVAMVTCPGLYGASTHLPSCIFLPSSPAAWVLIRVKVTPYLNFSWLPLSSYKHDPSLFCSLSLMLSPTQLSSTREQEHPSRQLCFSYTEVIRAPPSLACPRSFTSAASALALLCFFLSCLVSSSLARANPLPMMTVPYRSCLLPVAFLSFQCMPRIVTSEGLKVGYTGHRNRGLKSPSVIVWVRRLDPRLFHGDVFLNLLCRYSVLSGFTVAHPGASKNSHPGVLPQQGPAPGSQCHILL